jgi:exodeoxyribonuclease-5
MQLSAKQGKAYDLVQTWYNDPSAPQVFRLFGFAGTGKSTIANHLVSTVSGLVLFGTFTGKAASVLRKKGVAGAQTIHSMIYVPIPPSKSAIADMLKRIEEAPEDQVALLKKELIEINKPKFDKIPSRPDPADERYYPIHEAALIVVDEVSMVDEEMGRDLLSFGKKILVLGDPGQLPPVKGEGFFTNVEPDFLLDEVHRQAADSPIIRLATDVRSGGRLRIGQFGTSVVKARSLLSPAELTEYSQVLVGRNATRRGRNTIIRNALGHRDPFPVVGDRLICLKNDRKLGLFNGVMYTVNERSQGRWIEMLLSDPDQPDKEPFPVSAHAEVFLGKDLVEMPWYTRKLAQEFDYAYAITVHKAQGSQWESVLIENESYCFREHASRWLYTAITRAEDRVMVAL